MGGRESPVGVGRHYLRYSLGNLSGIIAGLVSFPLMTRLLDNTQYGILGYYDNWVLLAVAIAKFGAQHALLRFYPHGGGEAERAEFFTNFFYLPLAVSLVLWVAVLVVTGAVDWLIGARQHEVFWIALLAVPLTTFTSLVESTLRASEQSRMVVASRIAWRWAEVALMLGMVLLVSKTAIAAYSGKLLAVFVLVAWYWRWVREHVRFVRQHVNFVRMREGMHYGLPLVANEIVAVAVVVVDRLMLKGMLGDFAAVGIYSVGASLAMQLNAFMNTSLFEAITPTANRIFQIDGPRAVRELKLKVLVPLTYVAIGVALMLLALGNDAIIALSGSAKRASGPVFAVLGAVFALYPLIALCGFGLLLEKRTQRILGLMIGSLALNIALNLLWIPRFGVMGSVYASAISTIALAIGHCVVVQRELLAWPPLRVVTISLAAAAATAAMLWQLKQHTPAGWVHFILGGALGTLTYAGIVLSVDGAMRQQLIGVVAKFRGQDR